MCIKFKALLPCKHHPNREGAGVGEDVPCCLIETMVLSLMDERVRCIQAEVILVFGFVYYSVTFLVYGMSGLVK